MPPVLDVQALTSALLQAPGDVVSALLSALQRGRTEAAPATASKKVGRPKKESAAPVPLPEASADGAPSEDAYRVEEVAEGVCQGRRFSDPDKRWKPAVYREIQCGGAVKEDGLCETCARRLQKYAADPKPGPWLGLITEEPPGWCHMLGTDWALEKNPVWRGVDTGSEPASEAGSESGGSSQMTRAAAAEAKKAEKAAEREAKKAEKEAEKEAKKAEKEAEKAAKKAEKEAAAAAKKAEKEAAKKSAAPKKAAAAPKKAAAATGSNAAGGGPVPAKAATESAVEEAGELKMIDGALYMVKKGNVYEYDEISEKAGDFVGRLNADGESIDTDAEEEGAAESESD
jgi:hypothetical protein